MSPTVGTSIGFSVNVDMPEPKYDWNGDNALAYQVLGAINLWKGKDDIRPDHLIHDGPHG